VAERSYAHQTRSVTAHDMDGLCAHFMDTEFRDAGVRRAKSFSLTARQPATGWTDSCVTDRMGNSSMPNGKASGEVAFDQNYIDRLRHGCVTTTTHFSHYFSRLLNIVLRRYVRQTDLIDDIRQETLLRILQIARREDFRPHHLERFVIGTARLVSYEMMRAECRYCKPAANAPEPPDTAATPEVLAMDAASSRKASRALAEMKGRDGRILSMMLTEDADRTEICRRFGLTEPNLRVVIHRARVRLQQRVGHIPESGLRKAA
jgi:RNA polymerase sigma factor (sigma-70 family)